MGCVGDLEVLPLRCMSMPQTTFPIVGSGSSKDEVVVIVVEDSGEALLAGSEHLVAPGPTLAEVPAAPVFEGGRIEGQVLTEHVAAAENIPRFNARVHVAPALVAMGAGLSQKSPGQRLQFCFNSTFDWRVYIVVCTLLQLYIVVAL